MKRSIIRVLPFFLLAGMLAACGDDASQLTVPTSPTTAAPTTLTTAPPTTATTMPPTTTAPTTTMAPTTTSPYPWEVYSVAAVPRCVIGDLSALNVRTGPSTDYEAIGQLDSDATGVAATGMAANDDRDREWLEIEFGDGLGWAAGWFLTADECLYSEPGGFCVTDTDCTDRLNVRVGPGGGYRRLGSLAHDAVGIAGTGWATTDDRDRAWIQIEWEGGVAWAAGWYLTDEPCTPWPGDPCICPPNGPYFVMVHTVDPVGQFLEYDPIQYVWIGPADTEYVWENPDQTVLRLPIANGTTVEACPPSDPLYCNPPDPFVSYTLTDLAQWIEDGTEIGQNRRYWGEIPGHTGQLWQVELAGCSVVEINGIWFP